MALEEQCKLRDDSPVLPIAVHCSNHRCRAFRRHPQDVISDIVYDIMPKYQEFDAF